LAQRINQLNYGAVVAAWQIDLLPEEWIAAHLALSDDLPKIKARKQRIDADFAKWRNRHSTYKQEYVN